MHRRRYRAAVKRIGIALVGLAALPQCWSTAAAVAAPGCASERLPVTIETMPGKTLTVAGTLCGTDAKSKRIVLITSHGATYNHLYWDWPQKPDVYSLVTHLPASVSVLNIDLLGSGDSSHPPSTSLTLAAQASAMHQLVRHMRARGFEKVVLLGHSSGSGVITQEASTYHDVDGLIVTGFLHRFAPRALAVPLSLYPAVLDPAFAGKGLDAGYLTTRPGTRSNPGFYDTRVADPRVIAYDDAHKDTVAAAHAAGFGIVVNDKRVSRAVTAPVLSLVGNTDGGFCDSPACPQAAMEPAAWSPAAQLELHVIPNAGHDIHLHGRSAATAEYDYINEWLSRRFGAVEVANCRAWQPI
jgi:pimeloyl-ACP methyl ester carboxylesterase